MVKKSISSFFINVVTSLISVLVYQKFSYVVVKLYRCPCLIYLSSKIYNAIIRKYSLIL